jgi:hypothetical protein
MEDRVAKVRGTGLQGLTEHTGNFHYCVETDPRERMQEALVM